MSLNWAFPATINATGRNIHQRIGKGTLPSAKGVLLNNEYLGWGKYPNTMPAQA